MSEQPTPARARLEALDRHDTRAGDIVSMAYRESLHAALRAAGDPGPVVAVEPRHALSEPDGSLDSHAWGGVPGWALHREDPDRPGQWLLTAVGTRAEVDQLRGHAEAGLGRSNRYRVTSAGTSPGQRPPGSGVTW